MLDKALHNAGLNYAHLNHAWIAAHIPHQGNMCLLDKVETWDQEKIVCRASSHHAVDNPLRAHGQLGIACGIEYAAQAMAVHGALLAPVECERPRVGYLVSVRGVAMAVTRLDNIQADLLITASCIMSSENNILYQFSISADEKLLLEGRAAVVLNADALTLNLGNHA
ncbi:MAG: 3-hydroxylacyl-ACP dehydratase [Methylotenera sp.]|nr:3-hydroxylacyl-ACP dehydratase [Methylotenera sp.]MDD4925481.1 3-hydroxylacyl-ACP dehydratase [Methylotenera sp.]NOS95487.1 3-hydroxylacyl-ACP dehydratase [Methylotenera sp.]